MHTSFLQRVTILFFLLMLPFTLLAEGAQEELPRAERDPLAPEAELPSDQNVVVGQLENGLTYYIRENEKPENRAVLRLVVNAGSVLEDDDQQGLAHLVEHMAFNGTKNFRKHELIDYLESIGMQFGPETNAHTGFDETVYKITVPTEDTETVEKAFQILEDWAHNISFDREEVEKERGVVLEEWRLGRGAEARMRDQYYPLIFRDSRYAERLPIGNPEVLRTFEYETLVRYYRDWYRPELMAVVAVGDFEHEEIETMIREHFSGIPNPDAEVREEFLVPDHEDTIFAVVKDPEATYTTVDVMYKYDPPAQDTVNDYRRSIAEQLYNMMLNQRLGEITQQAQPPFLGAQSYNFRIVRTRSVYGLISVVKDGGVSQGLAALLTEAERVERHGFTEGELSRMKQELMSSMEIAYAERDKTESVRLAGEYVRNFLDEEPMPGIEFEYELFKRYLPEISLEEVNRVGDSWIRDENRIVLVKAPEKQKVSLPTEKELAAIIEGVRSSEVDPYEDTDVDRPLLAEPPVPGRITGERSIPELDVTEWTLSNGVKVILKPSRFKNDEIVFTSFSPGGISLVEDEHYMSAQAATSIISLSGIGDFTLTQLQKKLAGKSVSAGPYIGTVTEGFSGQTRPADLETAFQLLHLYFTAPRVDETAFQSFMGRMNGFIANRQFQPEAVFQDTLQITLAQGHFRERPLTVETLNEVEMDAAYQVYRERFADAGDFTFIFAGNFELPAMRELVTTYLGSLPSTGRTERWKDRGVEPPEGVVTKTIEKGLEQKSLVSLVYTGDYDWNIENNYLLDSLSRVLDIRLREAVREEASGTYGVQVDASQSRYPDEEFQLSIFFACDPERVEELVGIVQKELAKIRNTAPDDIYITKVQEIQKRGYEQNLKQNLYWVNMLETAYFHELDPGYFLRYRELVEALTAEKMSAAAKIFLPENNYVKIILYPENTGTQ